MFLTEASVFIDRNQMFQNALFSWTNQTGTMRRKQKKPVKIFLNCTFRHKAQRGQEPAGNFPNLFRKSALQMFRYPGLDVRLNRVMSYLQSADSSCESESEALDTSGHGPQADIG